MTHSTLTHLECGACAATYEPDQLINLCPACGKPLLARYNLRRAAETLTRAALGAQTAKCTPSTPSIVSECAPSLS